MILTPVRYEMFNVLFNDWESNRMYPPNYGKDNAMTKPKQRHVSAVIRAQNLLETGINVDNNDKLKNSIATDIKLLGQVREMLYRMIENPTLPFSDDIPNLGEPILDQIENDPNGAF